MAVLNSILSKEETIRRAGELAGQYHQQGFHCSESVIRAVPEALGVSLPADLTRAACGFFGGGTGAGGRCGVAEAGIMLLSWFYARMHPLQSDGALRVLVPRLLAEIEAACGSLECREIKPAVSEKLNRGCDPVYRQGAEIICRLLLEADGLLSER